MLLALKCIFAMNMKIQVVRVTSLGHDCHLNDNLLVRRISQKKYLCYKNVFDFHDEN